MFCLKGVVMKLSLLLAGMTVLVCTSLTLATETAVRVRGDNLCVTMSDGSQLCCSQFTLSAQGIAPAVFTMAGGEVRLQSNGTTLTAAEIRLDIPTTRPAATRRDGNINGHP
jgi:hypothetical protein